MGVTWPLGIPAHPRVSGENHAADALRMITGGSSPRERGKQEAIYLKNGGSRLIPA